MLDRPMFKEEHRIFREQVRKFCEAEIVPHQETWEKNKVVPREVWRKAGAAGLLCPSVPEEYGGAGADFLYSVVVMEEFARVGCSGFAAPLHSDVVVPYIEAFANDEQKKRWLPGCVSGEIITAIAMTEPGTGSDLAGVQATAVDKGDHYLLNGQKTFISNGQLCDLVIVVAKTNPQADPPHTGISLLVVEKDTPGFERGRNLEKMGMKAQDTSELFFTDVKVPKANLLGDEGMGFMYLMQKLQQERLVVAIASAAGMEYAVTETIKYAQERKAFGRPIAKFQNTQFTLVDMHTKATIARVFVDRLIEEHMAGNMIVAETSMAKAWCSDMLCEVVDDGVQVHGGYGYMMEYPIAKAYLDARVQRIYAGTNEIMKVIIAKTMGL